MTTRTLWTPVDCDCGKLAARARDSMPVKEINLFYMREVVDSLLASAELNAARIEALELELSELLSALDEPLSPMELVERLRDLRANIRPHDQLALFD